MTNSKTSDNEVTGTLQSDGSDKKQSKGNARKTLNVCYVRLHRWKLLSGVVTVLDIILICLIIAEVHHMKHDLKNKHSGTSEVNTDLFIVPCVNVSVTSSDSDANGSSETRRYENKDGKHLCSFKNLTEMVEKVTERHSLLRLANGLAGPKYLSCGNETFAPPPGYSTAFFNRLSKAQTEAADDTRDYLLHWDSLGNDDNNSYIGPGLKYDFGAIEVNETQIYFTYASVSFNQSMMTSHDCGSCFFKLSIWKARPSNRELGQRQLYTSQMLCNKHGNRLSTVYVGSHIYLQKHDWVYAKVSDASRLVYETSGNTFGIFPMT